MNNVELKQIDIQGIYYYNKLLEIRNNINNMYNYLLKEIEKNNIEYVKKEIEKMKTYKQYQDIHKYLHKINNITNQLKYYELENLYNIIIDEDINLINDLNLRLNIL